MGGILLFILIGTSPQSDVLAHAGGFLVGGLLGGLLAALSTAWSKSTWFDVAASLAYLVLGLGAWLWALT
jgi:hypothetical protein